MHHCSYHRDFGLRGIWIVLKLMRLNLIPDLIRENVWKWARFFSACTFFSICVLRGLKWERENLCRNSDDDDDANLNSFISLYQLVAHFSQNTLFTDTHAITHNRIDNFILSSENQFFGIMKFIVWNRRIYPRLSLYDPRLIWNSLDDDFASNLNCKQNSDRESDEWVRSSTT